MIALAEKLDLLLKIRAAASALVRQTRAALTGKHLPSPAAGSAADMVGVGGPPNLSFASMLGLPLMVA